MPLGYFHRSSYPPVNPHVAPPLPPLVDVATALRLKKIELSLGAAQHGATLQAQRSIAMLAVGATFAASAALAGFAGQVPMLASAVALIGAALLAILELIALRQLGLEGDRGTKEAMRSIDRLIISGGEVSDDG